MNQNTHGNDSIRGYVLINLIESLNVRVLLIKWKKTDFKYGIDEYTYVVYHTWP